MSLKVYASENYVQEQVAAEVTERDSAIAAAKQAAIDAASADATIKANTAESNAKAYADNLSTSASTNITNVENKLGDLENLETTNKSDLVVAINEVRNAVAAGGTDAAITLDTSTTTEGALKSYTIKQGSNVIGTIDIPKDMVVTSGEVVTNPSGQAAGTYIKLVLANVSEPLYINVGTLVDIYKAQGSATQVQLAIDSSTREISASIVAGSIGATELASNAVTTVKIADGNVTKVKLSTEVQSSLGKADSAVQSVESGSANGTIAVDGKDVSVKGLGSAAYTASTAYDAAGAASAVDSKLTTEVNRAKAAEVQALTDSKAYTDDKVGAVNSSLSSHTTDDDIHVTSGDKTNWNAAKTHADSAHARTDATKVEKSNTNGNIKINGTETVVYTHPSGTNPHGTTKSDLGLGNVDNTADANKSVLSASKLTTARTISLKGDATGSVNFDGSGDTTINVRRRRCVVGQHNGNAISTKPYYKFASIQINSAYNDREIVFKVSTGFTLDKASGILRAHFRTNGENVPECYHFYWEYANSGIDPSKFIMAYSPDANPTVELWVKIDASHLHYHFDVLQEHDRTDGTIYWTLYNTLSEGSQSAITSGYSQLVSSVLTIRNPILGNADTATKATQDASGNVITSTYETKANVSSHTGNTSNPHSVTKAQVGLGNVENKSSATIRGELTKANVTDALGYTPPTSDTTYSAATSSKLGLVKSGTDITVDANGNVSVNDDSHNHVISNVDGLQSALDGKAASSHGNHVPATETANNAKFLRNDNTWQTVTPANIGAAASSHGNHVPATETANNAKFLRNDNTWQTVTPANIGAAASSHGTHVTYSTTAPVMDGTASVGSAATVARSDHKHPTDTSRAAASDLANYVPLSGGFLTGKLTNEPNKAVAPSEDAFNNAPFVSYANTNEDSTHLSGYGFHNAGACGAFLYLDIDRDLKYITHMGETKDILTAKDFTVSGTDLILEWL